MPKHVWSVICYKGVIDAYDNTVSLLNILEKSLVVTDDLKKLQIDSNDGPRFPVSFDLVSWFVTSDFSPADEPVQFKCRMRIVDSDDTCLQENEFDVQIGEGKSGARLKVGVSSLPPQTGVIWFAVDLDVDGQWKEQARVPFEIVIKDAQTNAELTIRDGQVQELVPKK